MPHQTEGDIHLRLCASVVRAIRSRSAVFVALLLLQLPLILNPGYFSHDELEWWARANVANWTQLPWVPWTDIAAFQYRPLTFNLWLVLSHFFASTPYVMHLIIVGLGCANALLLSVCIEGAGASRRIANVAAIVFTLTPYAVYTHGWTGTLADLLTLTAALLCVRQLQQIASQNDPHILRRAVMILFLIVGALLCKESAIVLPIVVLLALYRAPRTKAVLAMAALAAGLVTIYLALRLRVILDTPPGADSYAWSIDNVPRRWLEYLLFPFMPPLLEVGPTLAKSFARLLGAATCLITLLAALSMAGWRRPLLLVALFTALLSPVLILGVSYDQYAYLPSAAPVALVALAWPQLRLSSKAMIVAVAAVAVVHGGTTMIRMHNVGLAQNNFFTDLSRQLDIGAEPIDISTADERDEWMAKRFLTGVPIYRGVPIAGHIALVAGPSQLVMQRDGHLISGRKRSP